MYTRKIRTEHIINYYYFIFKSSEQMYTKKIRTEHITNYYYFNLLDIKIIHF